jgi:hypothetical protein
MTHNKVVYVQSVHASFLTSGRSSRASCRHTRPPTLLPGPKIVVLCCYSKRPARPYKSAIRNRFTLRDAKGAWPPARVGTVLVPVAAAQRLALDLPGSGRAPSHRRFAPQLVHAMTDSRTDSVTLFLRRPCDRAAPSGGRSQACRWCRLLSWSAAPDANLRSPRTHRSRRPRCARRGSPSTAHALGSCPPSRLATQRYRLGTLAGTVAAYCTP